MVNNAIKKNASRLFIPNLTQDGGRVKVKRLPKQVGMHKHPTDRGGECWETPLCLAVA